MTPSEKIVAEEDQIKKDNERFQELNSKQDRTDEENKELSEVKERYGKRMQSKIDREVSARKAAEENSERLREENERLKREKEDVGSKKIEKPVARETTEINGKQWYTNEALGAMVDSGQITPEVAYKYQQERMEEAAADKAYKRLKGEQEKESVEDTRKSDVSKVLKDYPHFNKSHPDFNPEDPLYKKATELWDESYKFLPDGMSKSIARAKEILRINDARVDRSDDFEIEPSRPSGSGGKREKEVTLTEEEAEVAERQFCKGDIVNPKTNKPYTPQEARSKMLEAKKRRIK
jgi:hypothetical protein